ncbi:hypothetical protein A3Q56_06411 [Intoshia linei]|uniref:Uncharacterized protein n=1 Tax=Intoshia linei TaxID=1819745 RepID=A0A177AV76_9BILA|nr:hypothetical protein A3Q56_06411 [Intoshia linei]
MEKITHIHKFTTNTFSHYNHDVVDCMKKFVIGGDDDTFHKLKTSFGIMIDHNISHFSNEINIDQIVKNEKNKPINVCILLNHKSQLYGIWKYLIQDFLKFVSIVLGEQCKNLNEKTIKKHSIEMNRKMYLNIEKLLIITGLCGHITDCENKLTNILTHLRKYADISPDMEDLDGESCEYVMLFRIFDNINKLLSVLIVEYNCRIGTFIHYDKNYQYNLNSFKTKVHECLTINSENDLSCNIILILKYINMIQQTSDVKLKVNGDHPMCNRYFTWHFISTNSADSSVSILVFSVIDNLTGIVIALSEAIDRRIITFEKTFCQQLCDAKCILINKNKKPNEENKMVDVNNVVKHWIVTNQNSYKNVELFAVQNQNYKNIFNSPMFAMIDGHLYIIDVASNGVMFAYREKSCITDSQPFLKNFSFLQDYRPI